MIVLVTKSGIAQDKEDHSSSSVYLINLSYGLDLPGGDLADRFGNNFSMGGSLDYMTGSNWIMGGEVKFIFGNNVHEDPLAPLRNDRDDILGINNFTATVLLRERGLYMGLNVGKFFPFNDKKRLGIRMTAGGGMLAHKIRIQDDTQSVPQIEGDYAKGYDRLTRGMALKESIGLMYLSPNKRINMRLSFDFIQGFTKNVRSVNYDTGLTDDSSRLDMTYGITATWIIPIYTGQYSGEEIYY